MKLFFKFSLLLCFFVCLVVANDGYAGEVTTAEQKLHPSVKRLREGSYFGYTVVKSQSFKIPTALEIIKTNELVEYKGNVYNTYFAILKFSLGGFDSIEYTTQDYRIYVHKDFTLNNNLEKNRHNQMAFINTHVSEDGLLIKGELDSQFMSIFGSETTLQYWGGGDIDKFIAQQNLLYPEHAIIPALTGGYEGNCAGRLRRLQLMAVKNSQHNGSLLKGFKIEGRHGFRPLQDDFDRSYNLPLFEMVYAGRIGNIDFNFFKNKIILPSFVENECRFRQDKYGIKLVCGEQNDHANSCVLHKKQKAVVTFNSTMVPSSFINLHNRRYLELTKGRSFFLDSPVSVKPKEVKEKELRSLFQDADFAGIFQFAHDDFSQRALFGVDVTTTTDDNGETGTFLTLQGKIFFGEKKLDDAPYFDMRFPAITLNDDVISSGKVIAVGPQFVTVLKFLQEDDQPRIQGHIYARDYGYFGKVDLSKVEVLSELEKLNGACKTFPAKSGTRQSNSYGDSIESSLDLVFSPASHTDSNREDVTHFYFDYQVLGQYRTEVWFAGEGAILGKETYSSQSIEYENGYDPFTRTLFLSFQDQGFFYGQQDGVKFRGYLSHGSGPFGSPLYEMVEYELKN